MKELVLMQAVEDDCMDLFNWRSHPQARDNFFDNRIFTKEEHVEWFDRKIKEASSKIYIARSQNDKVGVIRFEMKDDFVDVSVNVNPLFFNQGFGTRMIALGTEKFYSDTREPRAVVARIKDDNIASRKAFSKAGYIYVEEKDGRVVYKKTRVRNEQLSSADNTL